MSIKKIAEITGTSPATVSRVLNNPSYKCAVPGLRDKIWRAAMDFFYPEYVIETYQTEKEGFQTMQKFLKLKEPPTGIYCANDITAIDMLKCLNRYSSILYRPSIISCDDIEEGQFIKPMLSTVQLPNENMARFALFVLLDRIRGGHKEAPRYYQMLLNFLKEKHLMSAGFSQEITLIDDGMTSDPEKFVTEIRLPVCTAMNR